VFSFGDVNYNLWTRGGKQECIEPGYLALSTAESTFAVTVALLAAIPAQLTAVQTMRSEQPVHGLE